MRFSSFRSKTSNGSLVHFKLEFFPEKNLNILQFYCNPYATRQTLHVKSTTFYVATFISLLLIFYTALVVLYALLMTVLTPTFTSTNNNNSPLISSSARHCFASTSPLLILFVLSVKILHTPHVYLPHA